MPLQKIMAFFMHEKEEALCSSLITYPQKTDSYIIGMVDDAQLEELRKRNIVVQLLAESKEPDVRLPLHPYLKRASENIHTLTGTIDPRTLERAIAEFEASGFPAYYKIRIDGALMEEYKEKLAGMKKRVQEFIPPDAYLIQVENEDELTALRGFSFITDVIYYSSVDTTPGGFTVQEKAIEPDLTTTDMLTFDILLHDQIDMGKMMGWLESQNIAVAGKAGNKIRIYLLEDSPLIYEVGSHVLVKSFSEYIAPKWHNDNARTLTGIDTFTPEPAIQLEYNGDGQVVGVADTGIDDTHPDLATQMAHTPTAWGRPNNYTDTSGHGTHVAGSIVGTGSASGGALKGLAPGAKLFFQSIMDSKENLALPLLLQTLYQEAYDKGVRIHNNSWGSSTASKYTVNSVEVDDFVWQHKDMLLVFSAGNDGNAFKPVNAPVGFPDFLSIGSPASAKNVLTVGASRSTRTAGGYAKYKYGVVWPGSFPDPPMSQENVSGDSNALAGFSSRGPCDDLRVKPDLVAPGTDIASAKASTAPASKFWGMYPGNSQYAIMGGTSMAAPVVSGCAAILREYFHKKHQHEASAALLKAAIINGCKKLTGQDCIVKYPDLPNYNQGYGMIDLTKTIPTAANDFFFWWIDNYIDQSKAPQFSRTGARIRIQLTLPANSWLRVCLAYTDAPGRALQNNLNLMMDFNNTNQKWTGNENIPSLLKMPDTTNNVETIVLDNAAAGDYTIQVSGTNIIKSPQDYALVITAGVPGTSCIILNN